MRTWLAAAAAVPLVASFAAHAQPNKVLPTPANTLHAVSNFMLPPEREFNSRSPFQDGMIAEEDVAPNARVELGLAPMLGRNIHSVRLEQEPVPTNNPGVSFVLKFPR